MHAPGLPPRCLVVGSSDSSGGAGIQGDVKALAAVGCYAATVVVGLTAQDTTGIHQRVSVPPEFVTAQLSCVLADIGADAVKVGTVWSAAVLERVADAVAPLGVPVVVDPVLFSAAGSTLFADDDAVAALRSRLFPLATVVVPNRDEARVLAGDRDGTMTLEALAEAIVAGGAGAVVITGGGEDPPDDWFFDGRTHERIPGRRWGNGVGHGAGCAHAATVCGLLAQGVPLLEAARAAKVVVEEAVRGGHAGLGRGVHPVDSLGLAARRAGARGGQAAADDPSQATRRSR